jgi:hypothetical protein
MCVGRALFGLSLRELEERPGAAQPVFEAFGGVFQTVGKRDALGNSGSVKGEKRVELPVDERRLLARHRPDERKLGIVSLVQV